MFKNHIRISLIATFFSVFLFSDIQIVSPQDDSSPIYFVTSIINNGSYQSEIWEYQIGSPKAKRILVLQPNRQTIGESFSVTELNHLRDYVKQHDYLEKGWAEDNPAMDYTRAVWRFDNTHLLIRTGYEVMDAWARMGDSATRGRFGYYEFSLVELTDAPKVTSFFKIDFHDPAYKDWHLGTNLFTDAQALALNPKQPKLVLILTPNSVFCHFLICSSILILDYSHTPFQTTLVPLAYHPIWSPDGEHLAYLHTKCDKQFKDCVANLEIMSMNDGSHETVPNWEYHLSAGWDSSALASYEWLDSQNFFYRAFPPQRSLDYDIWTFKSFSPTTKFTTVISQEQTENYAILAEKNGSYYSFKEAKGFSGGIFPITLEGGQQKFGSSIYPIYNSRYPSRVLFMDSLNSNESFVVFESGNNQTWVDLSKTIPDGEWVTAIAP